MRSLWFFILFGSLVIYHSFATVSAEENSQTQPTFSQCKPYVDAALKGEDTSNKEESVESVESQENTAQKDSATGESSSSVDEEKETKKEVDGESKSSEEESAGESTEQENVIEVAEQTKDEGESEEESENKSSDESSEEENKSAPGEEAEETGTDDGSKEQTEEEVEVAGESSKKEEENTEDSGESSEESEEEVKREADEEPKVETEKAEEGSDESSEDAPGGDTGDRSDGGTEENTGEKDERDGSNTDNVANASDEPNDESQESTEEEKEEKSNSDTTGSESTEGGGGGVGGGVSESEDKKSESSNEGGDGSESEEGNNNSAGESNKESEKTNNEESSNNNESESEENSSNEEEIYEKKSRDNLEKILGISGSVDEVSLASLLEKLTSNTLKELKIIYENSIKPLEIRYKYRDLSNRHFGDPEIFSKPLVVFLGPWSGGKSSIINWLLGIENKDSALRTGADPSPAHFNILMHGTEDEVLDGTQLAADWTFSGLQKFGQEFIQRLRGRKLPNPLLEKVNIVEIPGILEVRKQVEKSFPFNDAVQWFIDRADILFLIYDPAKLDIGPETETLLDQLKGRESQVRIVLNKADSVLPDELLRVQAILIWNISPLLASAEPPTLYIGSLWGRQLNPSSPTSLLLAHENHFLQDIRDAWERRVETRIAAVRRFAVRIRNHAKMVDCYLNTFNNHKSFFSNKKKISDDIIENPQNYHIYEGLSTLTNISRYDLPDPDTYREFFRLNPLWEFPTLASTCTYFRGCPINKLDISIAYDLPELLGRFRRSRESIASAQQQTSNSKTKEASKKKH